MYSILKIIYNILCAIYYILYIYTIHYISINLYLLTYCHGGIYIFVTYIYSPSKVIYIYIYCHITKIKITRKKKRNKNIRGSLTRRQWQNGKTETEQ